MSTTGLALKKRPKVIRKWPIEFSKVQVSSQDLVVLFVNTMHVLCNLLPTSNRVTVIELLHGRERPGYETTSEYEEYVLN